MSRGKSRRPASFAALFLIGFNFFVSSCAGSGGSSLPSDLRFFRDRVEAILLDSASIVLRGDGGSCSESERGASFCLYLVKLVLRKLRVDTWTRQISRSTFVPLRPTLVQHGSYCSNCRMLDLDVEPRYQHKNSCRTQAGRIFCLPRFASSMPSTECALRSLLRVS